MSCGCTDPCQPNNIPCTCEARINSDCVTVSGATSDCLAIGDNLLLTDYLTQMDERICEKVDSITNFIALENVGTGSELYKGDNLLGKKQIRTVKSIDPNLVVTETADEIQLDLNIPTVVPPDGTETKLVSGTNTTVAGNGSIATPYSVNVTLDGSETKVIAGANTTVTGIGTTASPYVVNSTDTIADGSETKVVAGTNTTITGNGTISTPYIINSTSGASVNDATSSVKGILKLTGDLGGTADAPTTPTAVHKTGNETINGIKTFISRVDFQQSGTSSIGLSIGTGSSYSQSFTTLLFNKDVDGSASSSDMDNIITGALGNIGIKSSNFGFATLSTENIPLLQTRNFKLPSASGTLALEQNLQKVVTGNTTISNLDNNHTIFINNGATPITITIDSSVTLANFGVGFIQEGTGDVTFVGSGVSLTNPIGLKSKGQGYTTFIERKLNTTNYFLLGDTKA